MNRKLFTLASSLSLLLCLATTALWVRSYWRVDEITLAVPHVDRLISGGGGVFIESVQHVRTVGSWRDRSVVPTRTSSDYAQWKFAQSGGNVSWERQTTPYRGRADLIRRAWGPDLSRLWPQSSPFLRVLRQTFNNGDGTLLSESVAGQRTWVPYWLPVAVFAALPLLELFRRTRRGRRVERNACPVCGYDLRASPDRCPECGTAVARAGT